MSENGKKRVVVLGAGPCGMTAAWELTKNGHDVVMVEKDGDVGGLCRTTSHIASADSFTPGEPYRFDLGGHRFITKNKRLMEMVVDLMKEDLLIAERKSVILLRGREFDYPLNMKNLFKNLDLVLFFRAGFDYLKQTMSRKGIDESSFEGWIRSQYGKTLYDLFFGPYTEKLWGISPREISADWAVQRIASLNLKDMLRNLFSVKKEDKRTFTKRFFYPKKGIGQMFDMIREEVERNGAKIHFDSTPESIEIDGDVVRSVTIKSNDGLTRIECDHVISTIPLDELSAIVAGADERDKLPELKYRALRFLNILVDKAAISGNTWMYVSEAKYFMTRIQEPNKRSPFSAPTGKTSIMLEIPCNVWDETYSASDDELFKRALSDLKDLGVDLTGKTSDYFSTYADHAYPVYDLKYKLHVKSLVDIINRNKNLVTCGRQGLFRYIFMDTAMEMGLFAADHVMGRASLDDVQNAGLEKALLEVKSIV